MALVPAIDAAGATAGDVMTGKTFWGLTVAGWGLQTGTLACAATATGTAVSTDVLTGKTFSNSSSNGIGGSMPNNGAFGLSCGASNQTVTANAIKLRKIFCNYSAVVTGIKGFPSKARRIASIILQMFFFKVEI